MCVCECVLLEFERVINAAIDFVRLSARERVCS